MKFYNCYATTYHNGVEIITKNYGTILTDDIPENKTDKLTWENLNEYYYQNGLALPFNVWNCKKGRMVSFFNSSFFNKNKRDIKEWKTPLNIIVTYEYIEKPNVSIDYVLKWHDIDKAIQYLNERGLKI